MTLFWDPYFNPFIMILYRLIKYTLTGPSRYWNMLRLCPEWLKTAQKGPISGISVKIKPYHDTPKFVKYPVFGPFWDPFLDPSAPKHQYVYILNGV